MSRRAASNYGGEPEQHWVPETADAREAQLIHLADSLAEQQLRDGSASAQVISHFLKLGSSRERKEQEKLELEKAKLQAQVDQIKALERQEVLFAEAIQAMRAYQGVSEPPV